MLELFSQPQAWAALAALITMEVVLGIDNLIFISIITNKLPAERQPLARGIGIGMALILRLLLLSVIAHIMALTTTVVDFGISGPLGPHGEPTFETALSWRDIILLVGGIFLVFKASTEIHEKVAPGETAMAGPKEAAKAAFAMVVAQIIALDVVFSLDSILTAIGMTKHLPIMVIAVVFAVAVMALAAGPTSRFVQANPTVVMLALAFLLMIGMVLIADGFGAHVPKGYIYAAMAFAALVEFLNMLARRRRQRATAIAGH